MSEPIISVSGLRGIIGEQLTPLVAARYVAALAATLPKGAVVIGRDGRASGSMLAQAISATLIAHGLDVVDLGVAATPTVGVQVRAHAAVAGIQISASHNPKQYNGLKLFGADGRVLTKSKGEAVLAAYRAGASDWVDVDGLGSMTTLDDPHTAHLQLVLDTVDSQAIRARRFKVLLDSNHGAGSLLGRALLDALNCEVTLLDEAPDGEFAHTPEPLAENLVEVCQAVGAGEYDVGFCQDPDADRLAVIDECGRFIGEELTLALCLMQALPSITASLGNHSVGRNERSAVTPAPGTNSPVGRNERSAVTAPPIIVTNCATSSLSKALASRYGCTLMQSAVGEANVADLMISEQAVFGGEGNGGPIDPRVGYVRDSFVGMARILDLLASSGQRISQLANQLPPLSMVKEKISLATSELPRLFELLTAEAKEATASRPDGLKLDWGDRWLLVRGSNTEPIVRFIAEAPTTADAHDLCEFARRIAQSM